MSDYISLSPTKSGITLIAEPIPVDKIKKAAIAVANYSTGVEDCIYLLDVLGIDLSCLD
jgi:hypothetical protein